MQKIEYICYIHHTILFFCSKRSQNKLYTLSNNDDLQQQEITKCWY